MKFTTPCFIRKNTLELRQKLEEMGYEEGRYSSHMDNFIGVKDDVYFSTDVQSWNYVRHIKDCIDTGTNEALFLALAALREDSDEGQWFAFTELFLGDCHVFHTGDIIHYDEVKKMFTAFEQPMYVRKATPNELISHFTEKGGGE